ncbi:uncharacterized hydrophobic domain-containing protein [Actinopolymorpha cephalotaxi]|uniref:Hydrophobic protein (TIGR00271 family) n=1 Tax=Actinopolymorpha cephalotaxi TaxID=504797 RepID=A0A1I2RB90_9ACTN|nr:DUF389 domain-containing protein [Actinopolymorpha cephalotaxi]NYH82292.1 putative hydrophobic protein (TIGR00271 family) [Actinopolymorpha cephalotaxi]SFG37730.1 uncharacterized hydrophobic domain-containing protein [Actinopolymorpha cephalotaxi]
MSGVLHLRVTSPSERTEKAVALLEDCVGVANLAVVPGASIRPPGDLVFADIARESVEGVLGGLRDLGLEADGTIAMEVVDTAISEAAERAERAAPGEGADAVIWEEVVRRTSDDAALSWTFLSFLFLATALAAIAVVLDSSILVIGAMVVGPEFVALAAIAVGIVHQRAGLLRRGLFTLGAGFAVAIAGTTVLCLVARAAGWITLAQIDRPRPLTGFIWTPDRWSFVVAFIAGIAGVLSLTASKSGTLVGVFISVTTVPAAGNLAAALALGDLAEMAGSAAQLGINMGAIVLAGVATLMLQKAVGRPGGQDRIRRLRDARRTSSR